MTERLQNTSLLSLLDPKSGEAVIFYYISELVVKMRHLSGVLNKTVRYPQPSKEYEQTVV